MQGDSAAAKSATTAGPGTLLTVVSVQVQCPSRRNRVRPAERNPEAEPHRGGRTTSNSAHPLRHHTGELRSDPVDETSDRRGSERALRWLCPLQLARPRMMRRIRMPVVVALRRGSPSTAHQLANRTCCASVVRRDKRGPPRRLTEVGCQTTRPPCFATTYAPVPASSLRTPC